MKTLKLPDWADFDITHIENCEEESSVKIQLAYSDAFKAMAMAYGIRSLIRETRYFELEAFNDNDPDPEQLNCSTDERFVFDIETDGFLTHSLNFTVLLS